MMIGSNPSMEWPTTILTVSKASLFPPRKVSKNKQLGSITHHHHHNLQLQQQAKTPSSSTRYRVLRCHKMHVPGFGEASPEVKAAGYLHNFFTYVAVKIVCAQLQSYNPEAYTELMEFLDTHSLNDGDEFLAGLMRESSRHKTLALRILEVRSAYCKTDFEWDNLQRVAIKMINESNTSLMKEYVMETSLVEPEK